MEIIYTKHAEEKLKEREIDKGLVESTLEKPDRTLDSKFGRKIAQKLIGKKLLRIIYKEEDNIYVVITVYYTRPERYER